MAFRFNPITGQLDLVNSTGGGGGAVTSVNGQTGAVSIPVREVDLFTLNSIQASNKNVTLSFTPSPANSTTLSVENAGGMTYGGDFSVSGNTLSWSGLGLDGILSSGDNLTVVYSK